jgi:spore coat protein A, manganese oxidase
MDLSRRDALKLGVAVTGSVFLAMARQRIARGATQISAVLPPVYQLPFQFPPLAIPVKVVNIQPADSPYSATSNFGGTLEPIPTLSKRDVYDFTIEKKAVRIWGTRDTMIWGYNGISPGPTIKVKKGEEVLARFTNRMSTPDTFGNEIYTSVHLHGMASLPPFDGWANDITRPGEYKNYYYPNNRSATLWYHDHGVHRTALNDFMGLSAMYIVEDPDEATRGLPTKYGIDDFPLVLTDKIFDRNQQMLFDEALVENEGLHGDVILVNGVPWPVMTVERKAYRFRCLNGGISRAYNLFLTGPNNVPINLNVIGTDGGLLEKVAPTKRLRIGVAERYEVIIDFSQLPAGQYELRNAGLKNHPDYLHTGKVMKFVVPSTPATTPSSYNPAVLNALRSDGFNYQSRINALLAYAGGIANIPERLMQFERRNGMWTINGNTWGSGVNPIEADPDLGGVEIWCLKNNSGGWNHPIHIHLVDFLMLSRTDGNSPGVRNYEQGFKDVVYLGENETIKVLMMFGPHEGKYMFHCHNLTHEDDDMMRAFNVGGNGIEPVGTDGRMATRGLGPWDAKPIPSTGLPPL